MMVLNNKPEEEIQIYPEGNMNACARFYGKEFHIEAFSSQLLMLTSLWC